MSSSDDTPDTLCVGGLLDGKWVPYTGKFFSISPPGRPWFVIGDEYVLVSESGRESVYHLASELKDVSEAAD